MTNAMSGKLSMGLDVRETSSGPKYAVSISKSWANLNAGWFSFTSYGTNVVSGGMYGTKIDFTNLSKAGGGSVDLTGSRIYGIICTETAKVRTALANTQTGGEGQNQKYSLTLPGTPTGGTFALGFLDVDNPTHRTTNIAYNATAGQVQAAIEAVPNGEYSGNVVCTGGPLPSTPVVIEYVNALANSYKSRPSISAAGLSGLNDCLIGPGTLSEGADLENGPQTEKSWIGSGSNYLNYNDWNPYPLFHSDVAQLSGLRIGRPIGAVVNPLPAQYVTSTGIPLSAFRSLCWVAFSAGDNKPLVTSEAKHIWLATESDDRSFYVIVLAS